MAALSKLANLVEAATSKTLNTISGGNSANLNWALSDAPARRVNNLRLGEAIFLGREALQREPITGLHTDAITLVTEVIESKLKPTKPWGDMAQNAFGEQHVPNDRGHVLQSILAIGRQDVDPDGLDATAGVRLCGASSDHLIVESAGRCLTVGDEVAFQMNYSALLRAMTSPFVEKTYVQHKVSTTMIPRSTAYDGGAHHLA